MANEPVYVTFEFRGDIDKEVERITLGIKGLRDESARTYQRLVADSSAAYDSMSAESRKLAISVQENINALRDLSVTQKALDVELEAGAITTRQYTQVKAALALQEQNLREAISGGMRALNERMASERQASDSVVSLTQRLQKLTEAYYNMSRAEREGTTDQGVLREIGEMDKEIQAAQSRLSAYSRSAGTGFNGLSMSIQQVARELPSLTMGANMFFLAISNNLPILADNIRAARKEYDAMKASGQSATPVWKQLLQGILSWQTALVVGITVLSMYGKEIVAWAKGLFSARESLADTLETLDEFQQSVAGTSASTIAQLQRMSAEWTALGDDMSAKERYILGNRSAFDQLGVAIRDVSDAEKIFNDQKEDFIRGVTARAQAAAAMDMAAKEYKKAIEKMQEADAAEKAGVTFGDRFKSFMARSAASEDPSGALAGADLSPEAYAKERVAQLNQSASDLFQSGNDLIRKYIEYSNEEQETLKKIGLRTTDALVAGSVGAIKASIQQKQEALEQLTNKADYDKALKEIEEEQKKLEAITGKQDSQGKQKDPAPLGSIKYYERLISKTKELRDLATTDEDRSDLNERLEEYGTRLEEIRNRIILSGSEVVARTMESTLRGIDLSKVKLDTRMDIEKIFGDLDVSDLDRLKERVAEISDYGETLSEDFTRQALWGLYDITDAIGGINDELGETMSEVRKLLDTVGMMASGDYAGAALSAVTSVVSSIARKNQEAIAMAKEAEGDYWDAVNWKIERQIELMRELGDVSSNQATQSIQAQINELMNILNGVDLDVKLNKGDGLDGFFKLVDSGIQSASQRGDEFAVRFLEGFYEAIENGSADVDGRWNFRFYDVLKNLSQDEIISLQGIPEIWRILPDEIQEYIKQLSEAVGKQEELGESVRETLTGTTADSVADSVMQGLAEGKRSAQDFADDFQEMLSKAVLQGVKTRALEEPLRQWYESFAAASQNGLTEGNIASLKEQYDKIVEDAAKQLEDMEKVTGLTIGGISTSTQQARAGAYTVANQDSVDETNGRLTAIQVNVAEIKGCAQASRDLLSAGLEHLARIADNTSHCKRLERIDRTLEEIRMNGIKVR